MDQLDNGAVAHLGERIPCTDEVAGSIPVSSTKIICWVNDIRERNGGRPAGEETKTEWPTLEKFKSVYPIRPTLCGNGWGINLGDKLWEFHWNIWRCSIHSHIQSSAQHLRVSYNGNTWDFQSHDVGSIPTTRSRSPIAQLVEQLTVNQSVTGSSPVRGATAPSFS